MPELPEVETITNDLKKYLENTVIEEISILGTYKTLPSNEIFVKNLTGRRIEKIFRIAKNIIFEMEKDFILLIHLAMTGQVRIKGNEKESLSWERVKFVADKEGIKKHFVFCDMRMFGKTALLKKEHILAIKQKYGPELLDTNFKAESFLEKLKNKRTTVKNALLDQEIVSGLGNIYATDSLFLAGIHPTTATKNISLGQAKKLLKSAKGILKEGILHRGSTLGDKMYVDAFGKYGTHQNYFRIYGKEQCGKCHTKVGFIKINGRGTFFCPVCQPIELKGGQQKLL